MCSELASMSVVHVCRNAAAGTHILVGDTPALCMCVTPPFWRAPRWQVEEALDFAQDTLAPLGEDDPSLLPELEEVLALLAFPDPAA